MNSFQDKIGLKQMRKREIKIIVPFRFYQTSRRKFQKNLKIPLWIHFMPKLIGEG